MTGWLYGLYQRLAGKPMDEPLTFGDLWQRAAPRRRARHPAQPDGGQSLPRPAGAHHARRRARRRWRRTRSTGSTRRTSRGSFRASWSIAMVKAAGAEPDGGETGRYLRFPPHGAGADHRRRADELRAADPLQRGAALQARRDAAAGRARRTASRCPEPALEPCWFVDGGVCTSLPIHLFDKPMPRWPTFAVNLRQHAPGRARARTADRCASGWTTSSRPTRRDGWLREWWKRIDVDARPGDPDAVRPGAARDAAQAPARRDVRDRDRLGRRRAAAARHVPRPRRARLPGRGGGRVQRRHRRGGDPASSPSSGERAGAKLVGAFRGGATRSAGRAPRGALPRRDAARGALHRRLRDRLSFGTDARRGRARDRERARAGRFIGPPADRRDLSDVQLAKMEQLTEALLAEEENVPEPGQPGWPDHPALKPRFVVRVMPDA